MSQQKAFQKRSTVLADDVEHRRTMDFNIGQYWKAVQERGLLQFSDFQLARQQAMQCKEYVLRNLPELLEKFENRLTQRGATVLWAENAEEALGHVHSILEKHSVKKVVKSKTMTTEEIELNPSLQGQGYELWESDLGELICQLAGEKPYHIVTPAMHKSRQQIARIFHEKLGSPLNATAEQLTTIARLHLREAFVTADAGITGANFLLANPGALVMLENEGNGRLSLSCPRVHIAIAGIEKILPKMSDLRLFMPTIASVGTGQQLTCYYSIVKGARGANEPDGPEHLYVILLDNGRSAIYGDETLRQTLRCIRCGACLNYCPVYRTIGGHTYSSVYQGPIGSVITPHLRDFKTWHHLSDASSLCGACTEICPVKIDLHRLLLENRRRAYQVHPSPLWKPALKLWAAVFQRRKLLDWLHQPIRWGRNLLHPLMPGSLKRRTPPFAHKTFGELYRKHVESKKNS